MELCDVLFLVNVFFFWESLSQVSRGGEAYRKGADRVTIITFVPCYFVNTHYKYTPP